MLDNVELIVNFADHLFEDVFERDQAEYRAEFVDSHRQAGAVNAQLEKQFDGGFRLGNNENFAQHVAEMKFRGRLIFFRSARAIEQNPDEILDVNETDYVIEIAFVDRNA